MNEEILPPTFNRFIPATQVLKRWKLNFIEFKQLPQTRQIKLNAFIQTKGVDYDSLNPYSPDCGRARDPFGGIEKVIPISKEHFKQVMYDFYDLALYEYHKPEIVKDRSVCPQLEEEFVKNCPEYIRAQTQPIEEKNMVIPVPLGTTWDQIKIRIVNKEHIEIRYPGIENSVPYTSSFLGLANKPMLWPLFEQLAKYKGELLPTNDPKSMKANISNLRNHLKAIFPGIDGKPIKNYNPATGYVCNFTITDSSTR